jgi:hypothetical protein
MLAEPCRVGKIFDCLSRRDVDETLTRDVTPFLQTLVEQQLVHGFSGRNAMKLKTLART